jgi:cellulose synthase/poly-beta-1,6-N-acetylglucosamine synthase-like glycosyltransferase
LNLSYVAVAFVLSFLLIWVFYNTLVLAVGVRNFRKSNRRRVKPPRVDFKRLPTFSVIVPVKDEEKVVGRLLDALLKLDYPSDRWEVIIVEDGSKDDTLKVCLEYAERFPCCFKLIKKPDSNGKPSALNFGLKYAVGEIVAVFDADNIPEPDILKKAAAYFVNDPSLAAVQGRLRAINSGLNMLTKFVSLEDAVWCEAYLRGKDVLKLFVYLKGSCQFVRRSVLDAVGGFDGEALSEDMDLSVRLIELGYYVKYASDVCSWQEVPSNFRELFKQRTRWFRGTMEVALKYGRLMAKPSKRNIDAELTLLGPFVLIVSLTSYLLAFFMSLAALRFDFVLQLLMQLTSFGTSVALIICGLALAYASKPRRLTNLLWLPFVYFYWCLQAFVALHAATLIVFRRPRVWVKTEKTGIRCETFERDVNFTF